MNKPNFLIIMSDEHSAQYSSVYGHPIIKTPNMDKIAKQGMTFTKDQNWACTTTSRTIWKSLESTYKLEDSVTFQTN